MQPDIVPGQIEATESTQQPFNAMGWLPCHLAAATESDPMSIQDTDFLKLTRRGELPLTIACQASNTTMLIRLLEPTISQLREQGREKEIPWAVLWRTTIINDQINLARTLIVLGAPLDIPVAAEDLSPVTFSAHLGQVRILSELLSVFRERGSPIKHSVWVKTAFESGTFSSVLLDKVAKGDPIIDAVQRHYDHPLHAILFVYFINNDPPAQREHTRKLIQALLESGCIPEEEYFFADAATPSTPFSLIIREAKATQILSLFSLLMPYSKNFSLQKNLTLILLELIKRTDIGSAILVPLLMRIRKKMLDEEVCPDAFFSASSEMGQPETALTLAVSIPHNELAASLLIAGFKISVFSQSRLPAYLNLALPQADHQLYTQKLEQYLKLLHMFLDHCPPAQEKHATSDGPLDLIDALCLFKSKLAHPPNQEDQITFIISYLNLMQRAYLIWPDADKAALESHLEEIAAADSLSVAHLRSGLFIEDTASSPGHFTSLIAHTSELTSALMLLLPVYQDEDFTLPRNQAQIFDDILAYCTDSQYYSESECQVLRDFRDREPGPTMPDLRVFLSAAWQLVFSLVGEEHKDLYLKQVVPILTNPPSCHQAGRLYTITRTTILMNTLKMPAHLLSMLLLPKLANVPEVSLAGKRRFMGQFLPGEILKDFIQIASTPRAIPIALNNFIAGIEELDWNTFLSKEPEPKALAKASGRKVR